MQIAIRELEGQDVPFIYSSWLKSYRESPSVRDVPNNIYFSQHHELIERIFMSPYVVCYVATKPDSANDILGYLVAEKDLNKSILHWAYVKQGCRSRGVFKALVDQLTEDTFDLYYTHFTPRARRPAKERGFIYNPYFLYND